MLACWELVVAPVQNWLPWKAKLNAPEPIAALVNGVQVTAGEYTSSATPGPPFGVPHCPKTETGIEYWMLSSFWRVVLPARYWSYTPFKSWLSCCVKSVEGAGWVRSIRGLATPSECGRACPEPTDFACAVPFAIESPNKTL